VYIFVIIVYLYRSALGNYGKVRKWMGRFSRCRVSVGVGGPASTLCTDPVTLVYKFG
jgi:hypothetical protein